MIDLLLVNLSADVALSAKRTIQWISPCVKGGWRRASAIRFSRALPFPWRVQNGPGNASRWMGRQVEDLFSDPTAIFIYGKSKFP